jgi:CelD/BcsL family acetyltransferase involved in cellulose biosynthesis
MPLQIKLINAAEFDGLRAEWNDLLNRSACDSVFLRWEWIHTWWGIFQQKRRLFILTARRDGRLCGIAPFYINQTGLAGLRTLKFCSEELSPDYMDMIAERGQEEDVVRGLVNDILLRAGEWDLIVLDHLRAESSLLRDHSLFRDYVCTSRVSNQCPYIKIEGAFDDYYRTRSKLVSYGLQRKLRILLEEKKVTHQIVDDEEGLSKGLGALFDLHEKSTHLKKIQSNFLSPKVRQFHQEVSRHFFKEKILAVHLLSDGEAPISAIYAFHYKNKICVFQTGFDPAWKKWSAGAALLYLCVQQAFLDGLIEFDMLKGTEGYKSLWATAVRDEMRLTVYNRNLRGSLYHAMDNLKTALKGIKHALD